MNRHLERAKLGDASAVKSLVEALRPRIVSMAGYYARRCGEDTDDLLQEAWLGLLEALPEVDLSIGTPEQYLIQRARWRLLDTIKRARVRRCLPLDESYMDDMAAPDHEDAMSSAFVNDFTVQLKSVQQMILCYLLGGLTWREAGALLGCSSANIAYHVRQIRRQYEEWDAGRPGFAADEATRSRKRESVVSVV